MKNALFLRLTNETDKAEALEAAIVNENHPLRFEAEPLSFELVPGAPFAYWVNEDTRRVFRRFPAFENAGRAAKVGIQTSDDARFVRLWWENRDSGFVPFAKGGSYSPYFSDVHLTLRWQNDGCELKSSVEFRYGTASKHVQNQRFYFRPGLTWPLRTQKGLGLRALPAGCTFGHKGPAAFTEGDDPEQILSQLAATNSAAFRGLVSLQMAFGSFEVGVIQRTPLPPMGAQYQAFLGERARSIWSLKQMRDQVEETSHVFLLPALLLVKGESLAERAAAWDSLLQTDTSEIERLQAEIDEQCWELYGIEAADRQALLDPGAAVVAEEGEEPSAEDEGEEATVSVTPETLAEDLASWLFGAALGRWDAKLATGQRPVPERPGPFVAMPRVSRGMVVGADDLHPAKGAGGRYVPEHDLLVDDEGHGLDLVSRMLEVLAQVAGPQAEAWQQELAALLGTDLRSWVRRTYFERHLKRHSKSRRKAPVYWQLGTSSGSYSVWLYYPRLTQDSLYRVLNETIKPKVQQEEQRLSQLRQAQARRSEAEAQQAFVEELRSFQEEVARVAPLFDPNLDDGVLLNAAPLWRLTPHNGWRKDTKAAWEALAKGEYDWAHLALRLWPERVIPKCAKERHLALAHDLEGALKTNSVADLIAQHTRPAVQEALAQLQGAPAIGSRGRGAKPKKAPGRPPKGTS